MKIIKYGTPPDIKIWSGKCSVCGTEVEALQKELVIIHQEREIDPFSRIKCPVCGWGSGTDQTGIILLPTDRAADDPSEYWTPIEDYK